MNRTHKDAGSVSESGQPRRAGQAFRRGRVLVLASMLGLAPMVTLVTGLPQLASAPAHPVPSRIRHVGFTTTSVASMRAARGATASALSVPGNPDPVSFARAGAVTPVQDVAGSVTVVGVTWPRGAVSARDQFQIRTLAGTTWSQWQLFDGEDGGPDGREAAVAATVGGGTSPYVVTGASRYQVRSLTTDPTAPIGATVQVVDPGTSSADSVPSPGSAPGAAAAASIKPAIYTRAQWGADESLRRAAPQYGQVQLGFVHHTVSANSYASSQVPAMIRGIYAYHVKGQGWNDIGYNFLVDRFGRTWEGRYGGVDRAVVGAQTLNYNEWSMGVSAIGNFQIAAVPQAMTNAFKRIFAWKLSLSGLTATGVVTSPLPQSWSTARYFQRIAGHRDGFQTSCPGQYLYARLPEIRAGAAALIGTLPRSIIRRDVDRNGAADALSYTPSAVGLSITSPISLLTGAASSSPVRSAVAVGGGWSTLRSVSLSPDLNRDGKADIIALEAGGSHLRIYLGNGKGGVARVLSYGPGWGAIASVLAAGDRNGDGNNDILATNANGDLIYYPGNGAGSLYRGQVIASGWNVYTSPTSAGDLNGDRRPDLLATRTADGVEMMFAGAPGGGLRAGVPWAVGWGSYSPVVGGSDLDGDRYPDVYARLGDTMTTLSSDATGRMVRSTGWGSGWAALTQLSTGADWTGDGVADLLAVNPAVNAGTLLVYPGTGRRGSGGQLTAFQTRVGGFPTVPGADLVRIVGDVNGDGYTDIVARVRTDNTLVLLLGRASSQFAAPVKIGAGFNSYTLIEAAGDFDYDGVPDLLARDAVGRLYVYPLMRNLTFKPRMLMPAGWSGMLSVVGVGAFNGDANGDVVALRRSDHALILFRGDGPNALQDSAVLATGQNDLAQILGLGDGTADGKADLIARSTDGRLWLYPGNGVGGLGARQPIAGGELAGHVVG